MNGVAAANQASRSSFFFDSFSGCIGAIVAAAFSPFVFSLPCSAWRNVLIVIDDESFHTAESDAGLFVDAIVSLLLGFALGFIRLEKAFMRLDYLIQFMLFGSLRRLCHYVASFPLFSVFFSGIVQVYLIVCGHVEFIFIYDDFYD